MLYLGVDGGGTKTAFMIIDNNANIKGYLVKKACHYQQVGFKEFQTILYEGISKICLQNGYKISDLSFSFLGIPGYGEKKEDIPVLKNIITDIFKSKKFYCGNDAKAAWAGSLACQPGINIVAGTGAIGFGRDDNGNEARASGWGYFCGDEGSAYWLGKNVISQFAKQADGREEKSQLYYLVKNKFNIKRDLDLISILYKDIEKKRENIAELSLLLYTAAEKGDKKAMKMFKQAAYEHSLTVKALIKKLSFNKDILVSYSGGVFNAGLYVLKPLKYYLKDESIKFIKPRLKPVTGAALYALLLDVDNKIEDPEKLFKKLSLEELRLKEKR